MLGHHWENVSHQRLRLWETPSMDAGSEGADRFGVPANEPVGASDIGIAADSAGFTITNASASDLAVLVTLMARAAGADPAVALERLLEVTSTESHTEVLRIADPGDATAYARLWHGDIEVHEHVKGGFTASRSGTVLVPLTAGATFRLASDPVALRGGVVVAAVAAVGDGLNGALLPIERGPAASIGERPDPPA